MNTRSPLLSMVDHVSGQLSPVTWLLDCVLSLVVPRTAAVACTANDACYMGWYTVTCTKSNGHSGSRMVAEYQTQHWYYDSASGSGGWYCDAPVCDVVMDKECL